MRQIAAGPVISFITLFTLAIVLAIMSTWWILEIIPTGRFYGVGFVALSVVLVYVYMFAAYRAFLRATPLHEGHIAEGSRDEFTANLNILFYLMLFNSLVRTNFIPVPLMRVIYQILGARLGSNTYSAGAILDPPLTEFGADCVIGHNATLFSHAIEGKHFALARIIAGDRVTIGAGAIIMSDVRIGSGAIVAAGAVVNKGTRIGANELWGGIPARRLRPRANPTPPNDAEILNPPSNSGRE